jgi:putative oxidoreductase
MSVFSAAHSRVESHSAHAVVSASGVVTLAGRALFAAIFLFSGLSHFSPQAIGYAASQGVPAANLLVPASGIMAAIGGLSVLTRLPREARAWLLVLFLVPVTLTMHAFWAVRIR